MSINSSRNNERLRELVEGAGLTQLQALLLFNKGLGPAPYSESSWRAFFVDPAKPRFRPFKVAMLKHAEKTFGKLQKSVAQCVLEHIEPKPKREGNGECP